MEQEKGQISEALRAEHAVHLGNNPDAMALYDRLCTAAAARPDGIDEAAQHLVAQICELEIVRIMAREDIREHGLRKIFNNGRQRMEIENKSVGTLQRCIEEQRKLMAELQITPASRKGSQQLGMFDDGFDDF